GGALRGLGPQRDGGAHAGVGEGQDGAQGNGGDRDEDERVDQRRTAVAGADDPAAAPQEAQWHQVGPRSPGSGHVCLRWPVRVTTSGWSVLPVTWMCSVRLTVSGTGSLAVPVHAIDEPAAVQVGPSIETTLWATI